jgi:hypothetical protein
MKIEAKLTRVALAVSFQIQHGLLKVAGFIPAVKVPLRHAAGRSMM